MTYQNSNKRREILQLINLYTRKPGNEIINIALEKVRPEVPQIDNKPAFHEEVLLERLPGNIFFNGTLELKQLKESLA